MNILNIKNCVRAFSLLLPIGLSLAASCVSAQTPAAASLIKIGIQHYDAGVIADLITRPNGIIVVPPNFVVPANPQPQANPAQAAPAVAPLRVLPPGVTRIFILQSDNSLVFETDKGNTP